MLLLRSVGRFLSPYSKSNHLRYNKHVYFLTYLNLFTDLKAVLLAIGSFISYAKLCSVSRSFLVTSEASSTTPCILSTPILNILSIL